MLLLATWETDFCVEMSIPTSLGFQKSSPSLQNTKTEVLQTARLCPALKESI